MAAYTQGTKNGSLHPPCPRIIDDATGVGLGIPLALNFLGLEPFTMPGRTRDVQLALLDHRLPIGVIIVDATGKLLTQNAAARHILDGRDGLSLQQSRVVAAQPAGSAKLQRLVHEVCRRAERAADVTGRTLRVSRPSGRPAFHLFVAPLRPWGVVGTSESPTAAVFIADSGAPMLTWRDVLRAYGLTRQRHK